MGGQLKSRGFVVLGTRHDVGKTVVAAGLARYHRRAGRRVAVYKPITVGDAEGQDAHVLARAAGLAGPGTMPPALLDVVAPLRLAPLTEPALAAMEAGVLLDPGGIRRDVLALLKVHDILVMEGVGAALSPLASRGRKPPTLADVARSLGLSLVLVSDTSPASVGEVVALSLALRARRMPARCVIFNQVDPGMPRPDPPWLELARGATGLRQVVALPYCTGSEAIVVGTCARLFSQLPPPSALG